MDHQDGEDQKSAQTNALPKLESLCPQILLTEKAWACVMFNVVNLVTSRIIWKTGLYTWRWGIILFMSIEVGGTIPL